MLVNVLEFANVEAHLPYTREFPVRPADDQAVVARAFAEFAESRLPERIHWALTEQHLGDRLIGHISRDSTAINAQEKPVKKKVAAKEKKPGKQGRPEKGEERLKEPTRLERQSAAFCSLR